MLKHINIILGLLVTIGVIYASHTLTTPEPTIVEESSIKIGYDTPSPGSEGDQWEEFNDLMGSQQASTDQEQE